LTIAVTRGVSPAIERCELTHLGRTPIDLKLARLIDRGYRVQTVDVGECAKAEGGVICCSLVFASETRARGQA
jgi:N-dimethylarginine dimethylaminohydrolase